MQSFHLRSENYKEKSRKDTDTKAEKREIEKKENKFTSLS